MPNKQDYFFDFLSRMIRYLKQWLNASVEKVSRLASAESAH
jgi:hypothetical protein